MLRKEIVRRLVLAKALYLEGRATLSRPSDRIGLARAVLQFHDSVDLVIGAIADRLNVRMKDRQTLLSNLETIEREDPEKRAIPYKHQIKNLNTVRNVIKHQGIFPDPEEVPTYAAATGDLLAQACITYFEVDPYTLSLTTLVRSDHIRGRIENAESAIQSGNFESALVDLAYAAYEITEKTTVPWVARLFGGGGVEEPFLWTEPFGRDYTVTLLEHGVDPYTYHRFRNLTPKIGVVADSREVVFHWDKHYGHPANWTEKNARFCLEFCIDLALKFQRTPAYEYELILYSQVYEDVVTAKDDVAQFWDRPAYSRHWSQALRQNKERSVVFELRKGAAIRGEATDSVDDFGEWCVSSDSLPSVVEDLPGQAWVDKEQVRVDRVRKGSDETDS